MDWGRVRDTIGMEGHPTCGWDGGIAHNIKISKQLNSSEPIISPTFFLFRNQLPLRGSIYWLSAAYTFECA